jgi:hypothetical protein
VTRGGRLWTWAPVVALFLLWLTHVSLSYTAASLRCHDVALSGSVGSIDAFRFVMLAVTLVAAGGLAFLAMLLLRRRRARDDGDVQLAGFMGSVLSALFAAYLLWSIPQILIGSAVC